MTARAVLGKVGGSDGDTLADPTEAFEYFDAAWMDDQKPTYVHVSARKQHGSANQEVQESYVYSDGTGNVVMKKVQAEPGLAPELDGNGDPVYVGGELNFVETDPRWVGTGRAELDNKGNVIRQYEPFFSATSAYEDDEDLVKWGVTPVLRYDPLGRLVQTERPDGTIERVVFDPWHSEAWDPNDNAQAGNPWYDAYTAGTTEQQRAASLAYAQRDTPGIAHFDVLGRVVLTVQDNGSAGQYLTRVAYDVEGNPLTVTDARGNTAGATTYSPGGAALHHVSNDAGERFSFYDVQGAPCHGWDQRGHASRLLYDALRRPTHVYVDGGELSGEILRLRIVYGEGVTDAEDFNLRGKPFLVFDGAGVLVYEAFDFKGNVQEVRRRLATTYTSEPDWTSIEDSVADDAEADADAGTLLGSASLTRTLAYDALNRPTSLTTPDDSEQKPTYGVSGLLTKVEARLRGASTWTTFVDDITYDARGRRETITYGNGAETAYTYDPLSFRLTRIFTTRPAGGSGTDTLQDLNYWYDAAGNVVELRNDAEETVYFNNTIVSPHSQFEYDAIYRLTSATGREHATTLNNSARDHQDLPYGAVPEDGQALRRYTETYTYDEVGNFLSLHHNAGTGATWTRNYDIDATTNRLLSSGSGSSPPYSDAYDHDVHGNMTQMPHLASMTWNTLDQFREVDLGGGGTAYYTYGADGQRVRKVVVHNGSTVDERVYVGAWELYRRTVNSSVDTERETLHVSDDVRRIGMVETLTVDEGTTVGTPVPRLRLQLDNHLGSSLLELTEDASLISYEEYHPYGTTAYHAAASSVEVSAKRYRYTGKERDEETGLGYHGARYYAPWLGRWVAADPLGESTDDSWYSYCSNSPLRRVDPTGCADGVGGGYDLPPGTLVDPADEFARTLLYGWEFLFGGHIERVGPGPTGLVVRGSGGPGGVFGGALRAGSLRLIPGEESPDAPASMGTEAGASLVPVLDPAARLLTGKTVEKRPTSRGWAVFDLALDLAPFGVAKLLKWRAAARAARAGEEAVRAGATASKADEAAALERAAAESSGSEGRSIPTDSAPPGRRFIGTSKGDVVDASRVDVGLSRELRVAEEVGGRVAKTGPKLKDVKVIAEASGVGVKVDVIGPAGELILVGGPSKALDLGGLGDQLTRLKWVSDELGVPGMLFLDEGTPAEVWELAVRILGPENVFPITR